MLSLNTIKQSQLVAENISCILVTWFGICFKGFTDDFSGVKSTQQTCSGIIRRFTLKRKPVFAMFIQKTTVN